MRICHPNADSYSDMDPNQIYRKHETEKKRQCASRILEVEQATFTPSVFSTSEMEVECKRYPNKLAELVAAKKGESYGTIMSCIRARVSFALLISTLLCLIRGSRAKRRMHLELSDIDFDIEKGHANIRFLGLCGRYSFSYF